MKTVLYKVTSLMTDRAFAMKSFGRLFEDHVKNEIGENVLVHFLHCNAHYLLGIIVSSCEKATNSVECEFIRINHSLGRARKVSCFVLFFILPILKRLPLSTLCEQLATF